MGWRCFVIGLLLGIVLARLVLPDGSNTPQTILLQVDKDTGKIQACQEGWQELR